MEQEHEEWGTAATAARIAGYTPAWMRILGDRGVIRIRRTALGRLFDLRDVARLARERTPSTS